MNKYTFAQLSGIQPVCGEAQVSGREAQRMYKERYPQRQLPQLETNKRTAARARTVGTPDLEEAVLGTIEEKPFSSTCTIAHDLSPPTLTFCCISYRAVIHKGSVSRHMLFEHFY
jgi:hypothetical protein